MFNPITMTRKIHTAITLIAITAALILLHRSCSLQSQLESTAAMSTLNDSLLQTEISRQRDSLGREITAYKTESITARQFATSKSKDAEAVRSQLSAAKVKIKNLEKSLNVKTSTSDTIYITIGDTITGGLDTVYFDWGDDFLSINGVAYFDAYKFEGVSLDYDLRAESSLVWYWDKSWMLGRKTAYVSIMHQNPNTTTTGIQVYNIVEPVKWYETRAAALLTGVVVGVVGWEVVR